MDRLADLELTITTLGEQYELRLRLTRSDDGADVERGPFSVALDSESLYEYSNDLEKYGSSLASMVFHPEAAEQFKALRASVIGSGGLLRVRLRLPSELQAVRWELLPDPETGRAMAHDSYVLLSRHLSADDYVPVKLRSRGKLRALIAVAAPDDVAEYAMAPIDFLAETAPIQAALHHLNPTTIVATWHALDTALRKGYDIVYLVAHGALQGEKPWLYLVDDDGNVDRRSGKALADVLRGLGERRPRLIVLASCASAGDGYANTLAALGPTLASAGVPAVLAMQGNVQIATIARFAPVLFKELSVDGAIDRAVNSARLAVADQTDWWMPVLYTRLVTSSLWPHTRERRATSPVATFTLAGVATLLIFVIAMSVYWFWPRELTPMSEGFNVAIAGIAVDDGNGVGVGNHPVGERLSDLLFRELGRNNDIDGLIGWKSYLGEGVLQYRGTSQGVGFITGTSEERTARAASLAARLNADIVVYGLVALDAAEPGRSIYYPELYINPELVGKESAVYGEEILGSIQLGVFVDFDPGADRGASVEAFSARIDQLGYFLVGLEEYYTDRFNEARQSFCLALGERLVNSAQPCDILDQPAAITLPDEAVAVIFVFLGALEGRAPEANTPLALAHLERAHELWPTYARPFISKASILYRQILNSLTTPGTTTNTAQQRQLDQCFNGTAALPHSLDGLVQQTIACLDSARTAPEQPANVDVQPKMLLSIGSLNLLLAATTRENEPYWASARQALNDVIAMYEAGDEDFRTRFRRYAGMAYGRRGLITVYYPDYLAPTEKALDEYRQALADYRKALELMETTSACRVNLDACLDADEETIAQFRVELERLERRVGE